MKNKKRCIFVLESTHMQVNRYLSTAISPEKWDAFIMDSPQGNVYMLHGYMGCVVTSWEALVVEEEGKWRAVFPFAVEKKWGFCQQAIQPFYTQYWGIAMTSFTAKNEYEKLSFTRKITQSIAEALPDFCRILYRFSPSFSYLLPFYWKGFSLTVRYSYGLHLEDKQLWNDFAPPLQRQIRKAQKAGFVCHWGEDEKQLLQTTTQRAQEGKNVTGVKKTHTMVVTLSKICRYLYAQKALCVGEISDEKGRLLAAGVFVPFKNRMIYLAGVSTAEGEKTGAMSLLMWEALQLAQAKNLKTFDFEGSMIENIETFFRKFGATPQTYFEISKHHLPTPFQWMQIFKF